MTSQRNREGIMFSVCFHRRHSRPLKPTTFLCLATVLASITGPWSLVSSDNGSAVTGVLPSAAKRWVDRFCSELTKTKKISFVEELISNLEILNPKERPVEQPPSRWFLRAMIHGSGQPCLDDAAAILELKPIVKEMHNVCSKEHLDLLEDYYKKHIKSVPTSLINSMVGAKTITENFFMLYAKQVSHKCKKSMLKSLGQMESTNIVTRDDFEKALPWIRDSSIKNGCTMNRTPERDQKSKHHCKALSVISDIKNIEELVVLLKSPDAVLIVNKFAETAKTDSGRSAEESVHDDRNKLIMVVPPKRMQMILDLTMACLKFKPIYENTVLPVARLAEMGASVEFKEFDRACTKKPLMKKWFGLTLVCETILKSRLAENGERYKPFLGEGHEEDDIFLVFDECDDRRSDCSILEKRFTSQKEFELEPLRKITNNLDDELWIHKYKTTALQRLKENMKLFSIDDVESHIVFVQNTAQVKRWIGRGVVTALLTAAINSA